MMAALRPDSSAARPDTGHSTDSRRAAVFTGSWTEFMKLPDPVHAACEAADLDAVVSFLEGEGGEWLRTQGPRVYLSRWGVDRAADVNARASREGNKIGWTLIFYAAAGGNADVVKYLIEQGADVETVDQFKQSPLAYAKGSQARHIVKGELLKLSKIKATVECINDAHARVGAIPEALERIAELETKRAHATDALLRQHQASKAAKTATLQEDSSDEDRTDETIRAGEAEEVDFRPGLFTRMGSTSGLERQIDVLARDEGKERLAMTESLKIARKRVLEGHEAWDYVQRLLAAYRGRPPGEDVVSAANEVFDRFCQQHDQTWPLSQLHLREESDGAVEDGEVEVGEDGMYRVDEEADFIQGFDSGSPIKVADAVPRPAGLGVAQGARPLGGDFERDANVEEESMKSAHEGDRVGREKVGDGTRTMNMEGLMSAAASLADGVVWDEILADDFMEKYSSDDENHELLTNGDFVKCFEDLVMRMRLLKLQLVVDNALEENGAREMVAAHGFLAQQRFDDALASSDLANLSYTLLSTVPQDRKSFGDKVILLPDIADFQDRIPHFRDQARSHSVFLEALKTGKSVLSEVEDMATSYFARPSASQRLMVAQEALQHATESLFQSLPPPQLSSAHVNMLVNRRCRTPPLPSPCGHPVHSAIHPFDPHFPIKSTLDSVKTLVLPEGDQVSSAGRDSGRQKLLTDRTRNEVIALVTEGEALMEKLPGEMTASMAEAIELGANGGSPVAHIICENVSPRRASPGGVAETDDRPISERTATNVAHLVMEGQDLLTRLPANESATLVETIERGGSPVADLLRIGLSPNSEMISGSNTAGTQEGTVGHARQTYSSYLPGEDLISVVRGRSAGLNLKLLGELLIMCGVKMDLVSDTELLQAVEQVLADRMVAHEKHEGRPWSTERSHTEWDEKKHSTHGDKKGRTCNPVEDNCAEAEIICDMYAKLQPMSWLKEAKSELTQAMDQLNRLGNRLKFYQKGEEAYGDANREFEGGAFTDAMTKATEADKLFALSESHDQKLLVRELATRSHMANDKILRDLAYENMLRSGELIDALKFDEARTAVQEAADAYQKLGPEYAEEIERANLWLQAGLQKVNSAEEEHFYQKLRSEFDATLPAADKLLRARLFMRGYEAYESLVPAADDFLMAFPSCTKGARLIAHLHARRALTLSSHGNDMGQQSGPKWHEKALEAARIARKLAPHFADAVVFEALALLGTSRMKEACDVLEAGLANVHMKQGGGSERRMAQLLAMATAKIEEDNALQIERAASRASSRAAVLERISSFASSGGHSRLPSLAERPQSHEEGQAELASGGERNHTILSSVREVAASDNVVAVDATAEVLVVQAQETRNDEVIPSTITPRRETDYNSRTLSGVLALNVDTTADGTSANCTSIKSNRSVDSVGSTQAREENLLQASTPTRASATSPSTPGTGAITSSHRAPTADLDQVDRTAEHPGEEPPSDSQLTLEGKTETTVSVSGSSLGLSMASIAVGMRGRLSRLWRPKKAE